ncbi:MAG: hypothetical protein FWE55_05105, partial [Synergistaceae bacterium]|nr:hypothetical protein [Synergistaceae bacterium]
MKRKLILPALLFVMCLVLPGAALAADETVSIGGAGANTVVLIRNAVQGAIDRVTNSGGGSVTVTGSFTSSNTPLTLNITDSVTVKWSAVYSGTISSGTGWAASSLIALSGGSGTFEVSSTSSAWLANLGSGNTIHVPAANIRIIVGNNGIVQAESGVAIFMEGVSASVTVQGNGSVFNNSEYNVRPAIQMANTANTGTNVTVRENGSVGVIASVGNGYAIQTYGNVAVSGNSSVFANGEGRSRAINALGANSEVRISGNARVWSINGITIHVGASTNPRSTSGSVVIEGNALVYNTCPDADYPVIGIEPRTPTPNNSSVVVRGFG